VSVVALSPTIIKDVASTIEFTENIIDLADATFVCAVKIIGKPLFTPTAVTAINVSPEATLATPR